MNGGLTGERLDGLHGPLVVRTVHEGVPVLHEELSGERDLVLVEGLDQVLGGHAVAQIPDVQLVHGGRSFETMQNVERLGGRGGRGGEKFVKMYREEPREKVQQQDVAPNGQSGSHALK